MTLIFELSLKHLPPASEEGARTDGITHCVQSDTLPSTLADFSFFTLTILTDRSVERRSGPLNVCCL